MANERAPIPGSVEETLYRAAVAIEQLERSVSTLSEQCKLQAERITALEEWSFPLKPVPAEVPAIAPIPEPVEEPTI